VKKPKPFVFEDGGEARRFAPATLRNRDAIADVLRPILPPSGTVLEIASGTGEHILYFAGLFPDLIWQPSDPDTSALVSIEAWRSEAKLPNLQPPLKLDVIARDWAVEGVDGIICINMIHIAPWEAAIGLMEGAGKLLPTGGLLYLYGPYREEGVSLAQSNASFDISLKSRNPAWGLKETVDVIALAKNNGLSFEKRVEMPSNNLSLIFRKE